MALGSRIAGLNLGMGTGGGGMGNPIGLQAILRRLANERKVALPGGGVGTPGRVMPFAPGDAIGDGSGGGGVGDGTLINPGGGGGFLDIVGAPPEAAPGTAGSGSPSLLDQLTGFFEDTSGLRSDLVDRAQSFLSTGDISRSPLFNPLMDAVNDTSTLARRDILASVPAGGTLSEALTSNILDTARRRSDVAGTIGAGELDRAFTLATNAPLSAAGIGAGLEGQLAAAEAARAAARADRRAARDEAIGGIIGTGLGAAIGKCSRTYKDVIEDVDPEEITRKFLALPCARYRYKGGESEHIGTFAEEFNEAFGFDAGDEINLQDWLGVVTVVLQDTVKRNGT